MPPLQLLLRLRLRQLLVILLDYHNNKYYSLQRQRQLLLRLLLRLLLLPLLLLRLLLLLLLLLLLILILILLLHGIQRHGNSRRLEREVASQESRGRTNIGTMDIR